MKSFVLCFFIVSLFFKSSQAQIFNIKEFGAVADGKTLNTTAIQKAVEACAIAGGGMVYIPSGNFVTGTFHLKSNVNLHLDNGAILTGSANLKDYESYTMPEYGVNYYGIIYTKDVDNVSPAAAT